MNPTIEKFGWPATLVREFDHWMVLAELHLPNRERPLMQRNRLAIPALSLVDFGETAEARRDIRMILAELRLPDGECSLMQRY